MIIYSGTKQEFSKLVVHNEIDIRLEELLKRKLNRKVSSKEKASWQNSLQHMNNIMMDRDIPDDAGVAIEYNIPLTGKRIDFIISGSDDIGADNVVIVELKQWSTADITDRDGEVRTVLGGAKVVTRHPSYQAYSYAQIIKEYNRTIREKRVGLFPSAYLHNYQKQGSGTYKDDVIHNVFYKKYTDEAPAFLKGDTEKFRKFIKKYIKKGDTSNILHTIEHGVLKPSKVLAASICSMLRGKEEFVLLDEQKTIFNEVLEKSREAKDSQKKQVLIVEGGPGTGKSVVAINCLVEILKTREMVKYVTRNSAPKEVYKKKLARGSTHGYRADSLFGSTGEFHELSENENHFNTLLVDEAHRITEKSGAWGLNGENQIKELINAAKVVVFFIDENQVVSVKDYGSKEEIEKYAKAAGAEISYFELPSQFRCGGSDGYIAWLDNVLGIKETANFTFDAALGNGVNYDIKTVDSVAELHEIIREKNKEKGKARLLAGYCWDWGTRITRKDGKQDMPIALPNKPTVSAGISTEAVYKDVKAKIKSKTVISGLPKVVGETYIVNWNLASDGQTYILNPESVNEVGAVHTTQGLELDYVGVIIGPDLIVRDGKVITDVTKRAKTDQTIKGLKKRVKLKPKKGKTLTAEEQQIKEDAIKLADKIIKNSYRVLMTRGMKGCYIYSSDPETHEYFSTQTFKANVSLHKL